MATLPNALPKLAADPSGRALGLRLPAGRLIDVTDDGPWHEPFLWCADARAVPGAWSALAPARHTAGLLPVVVDVGDVHNGVSWPEGWELRPGRMSYPGDHDAEEFLAECWDACTEDEEDAADGVGWEEWPGLAPDLTAGADQDPDSAAADLADSLVEDGGPLKDPRLALVPARRSADIPTVIGWTGPLNHENDTALVSAVLRSWEDRFGLRVVALGFDHLIASVAAPPTTPAEAEAVAAEHFAFCPDNIWQGEDTTLRAYAEHQVRNQSVWSFWWD